MKKITVFISLWLLCQNAFTQEVLQTISGTVTDGVDPLTNVNIVVKNTQRGVKTNALGKYLIRVNEGETLVYSYVGKKTLEIIVEDVTEFLNIAMHDKVTELDEVRLTRTKRKTQKELFKEYNTNKDLIKTAYGILDKKRSGFSMKIADGEDLILGGVDFTFALSSLLPGIRIATDSNLSPVVFLPRRFSSFQIPRPVLFDVDGNLFTETPVFIQTENIKRVAIINAAGALIRYGNLAAGGVVVINTKSGNFSPSESESAKLSDQAKLRNNFYVDKARPATASVPAYMTTLQNTSEIATARKVYLDFQERYGNFPHFHLDAMSFFLETFGDRKMFDEISNEVLEKFEFHPAILKALAYKHEAIGNFERAKEIYKMIFILRPHYPQSYLNLANSYDDSGNPEKAATLFARYTFLVEEGFFEPSQVFEDILERDFNNLLGLNGTLLSGEKRIFNNTEDDFQGTRIVFEWNDGEAEFELQFVNPEGQYSLWKHTLNEDPERISDEKKTGYSCEEKLIYDPTGDWLVNVKYLGNKSLTPTYLKATVYWDFGTKKQRKQIKVFKLNTKNSNQELFVVPKSPLATIR